MTRAGDAGFTLVEVMVSLLIFGMLAAAGVAILAFSVRAQGATATRLDDIGAVNRTVSILAADLAQARARATRDEGGVTQPAFQGEADGQMRFVRAGWSNVDDAPRPGIQKVAYRPVDGAYERLGYPMPDGSAPLPAVALLDRVAGIAARYRYRGAWSDRWDGAAGIALPDAVELRIRRTGGVEIRAMMLVGTGYAGPPLTDRGGFGNGPG